MVFPHVTALTAGVLLILQMLLAFLTSGARGKAGQWVGFGEDGDLLRAARRHGNLSENAAIFLMGFLLVELSGWNATYLTALCVAFVVLRLLHAAGLSREYQQRPPPARRPWNLPDGPGPRRHPDLDRTATGLRWLSCLARDERRCA